MSIFKKKNTSSQYNVLEDNYVPAALPTISGLENFVTSEYSVNKAEVIANRYEELEKKLGDVIKTCDIHSSGTECDHYIDNQIQHLAAVHGSEIADHEHQIVRIKNAQKMRVDALNRRKASLTERSTQLTEDIQKLEGLHAQFQLHIGGHSISLGLPITLIAMIVDACVNYSFLQSILLSNAVLLAITVICMSVMSDGSMWALATYLNHRNERFIPKPVYSTICASMLAMFLISVIASVMVRYGSMDATYGTINAAGEFVGKDSYSLAEYGITLVTSIVTTATGILSFAFTLDTNGFLVTRREHQKKELIKCKSELEPVLNELELLENAPDPRERDEIKRKTAEHQMEAIRTGLKNQCRKQMTILMSDATFTEKMEESGSELIADTIEHKNAPTKSTTINLSKVS